MTTFMGKALTLQRALRELPILGTFLSQEASMSRSKINLYAPIRLSETAK